MNWRRRRPKWQLLGLLVDSYGESTITGNIQYPGQSPSLIAGAISSENNISLVTATAPLLNSSMSGQFNTAPNGHQGPNGLIRGILTAPEFSDQMCYSTFSFGRYVAIPRDRM